MNVNDQIMHFVTNVGEPLINDLMTEIEIAMEETSPVLWDRSAFSVFNPDCLDKSTASRRSKVDVLVRHYGQPITDKHAGHTTTADPIINGSAAEAEAESDFFESFDSAFELLSTKLKDEARNLVRAGKLKQADMHTFISERVPTSPQIYKFMAIDGSDRMYPNMMHLFRISMLIPPSTANVERGFSVMNLICSPLRSSLSENSLDNLMRMCLNGPDMLSDSQLQALITLFKNNRDNRKN